MPHIILLTRLVFPWPRVLFILYFLVTSRVAQSPAACDVVIPLFSIGCFLSLLVISPDFSLDLACAYSTFKCVAGRDTSPPPLVRARGWSIRNRIFGRRIHSLIFLKIYIQIQNVNDEYNIHFGVCFTICILLFDTFQYRPFFFWCHKNMYYLDIIIFFAIINYIVFFEILRT